MTLIGYRSGRGRQEPTPDDEYEELNGEQRRLHAQIRDLEGFIGEAPQIKEQRLQETRVTLPPLEDGAVVPDQVVALDDELVDGNDQEDLQERFGRRHLAAMRRARRKNFLIFLVCAAAVAGFLYWVLQVVQ